MGFFATLEYVRKRIWLLPFTVLCVLSFLDKISAQEIDITNTITRLNITPFLLYWEDKNNELSFTDIVVKKDGWSVLNKQYVNFGYTQSAYWFKINLINNSKDKKHFLLEIDFPTLDKVVIYRQNNSKIFTEFITGDTVPFNQREIQYHNFLFDLIEATGSSTVYLKISNSGSFRFKAMLYHPDIFIERKGETLSLLWVLYGSMSFIIVLFLFLFLFSYDKNYLYFALFSLLLLIFQLTHRGFAFQFLWPEWPWWSNVCSPFVLNLMTAFGGLFYCSIMGTKNTNKWVDYFLKAFAIFIFPLNALVSIFAPLNISLPVTYYLLQPLIIFLIIWTVYYLFKGIRFARYFVLGVLNVGFFTIIGSLTALGKMPSTPLTEWSTEFGFVGLILFSSLGLIERIVTLNRELVNYKNTVDQKNQELEASNEELQAAMEELEATNEELERQYEELVQ